MRKRFQRANALILAGLLSVFCVSCSGKKDNKSDISGGSSSSENAVSIENSDNTAIFKKSELNQPEDIDGLLCRRSQRRRLRRHDTEPCKHLSERTSIILRMERIK